MLGNLITVVLLFHFHLSNAVLYDPYYGVPLTEERKDELTAAGTLDKCTLDIEPCDESEGRRIDGSCNNLKNPTHGSFHTPQVRLLPPVYDEYFEPRRSKSGKPMKIPRDQRQALMPVGITKSPIFNMLMTNFAEYSVLDVLSGLDILNYLFETTHCCKAEGLSDYMCTPIEVPEYDPVHRFSGHRCMNQTRPYSFQNRGCVAFNTTPDRMDYATVTWDLNNLYNYQDGVYEHVREYEGGRLKTEVVNGRVFPSDGNSSCMIQDVIETGCTRNVPNGFIGTNLVSILLWRLHNVCARKMAEQNPGWSDDKIFFTCRDIIIAFYVQIVYYELWPLLLGRDNMLEKGIILEDQSNYRDIYDQNVPVQLYIEYPFVMRWFHNVQNSEQYKIAPNGTVVGSMKVVDNSVHVEQLAIDDNIVTVLHGAVQQPGGDHNRIIDPDMADRTLGSLQTTIDVCSLDISKGGLLGMAPYIRYRDVCTGYTKTHETFDDLKYIMEPENLEILREVFEDPEDIGLMAGIVMEKHIKGGHIPDTAAYVVMEQLYQSIRFDRHWYERPNRPNAYTPVQLLEVRKSTMAALLCLVGDEFTHVQPEAFLRVGPGNEVVSCDEIPKIDFSAWKEESCN